MNIIENLIQTGSEEGGELAQAFSKANRFGMDSVHPRTNETARQMIVKEFNDLLAVIELLKDRDVVLEGIGDPVAVGEAKKKIVEAMEVSHEAGLLQLPEEPAVDESAEIPSEEEESENTDASDDMGSEEESVEEESTEEEEPSEEEEEELTEEETSVDEESEEELSDEEETEEEPSEEESEEEEEEENQ